MAMTQEQVAQRARVSTATVSRVLNNKGGVGSALRVRVMKAIEELKYNPNLDARGLAAGSRSVGVIVSNFENPFFLTSTRWSKPEPALPGLRSRWPTPAIARSA